MSITTQFLNTLFSQYNLDRVGLKIIGTSKSSYIYSPCTTPGLSKLGGYAKLPVGNNELIDSLADMEFVGQFDAPGLVNEKPALVSLFVENIEYPPNGKATVFLSDPCSALLEQTDRPATLPEKFLTRRDSIAFPRCLDWSPSGPDFVSIGLEASELDDYHDFLSAINEVEKSKGDIWCRIKQHPDYWFESSLYVDAGLTGSQAAHDSPEMVERAKYPSRWIPLIAIPTIPEVNLYFGDCEDFVVWIDRNESLSYGLFDTRTTIEQ